MKLLVTGSSGFIGKNFLLSLPKDWQIFGGYYQSTDFNKFLEKNSLDHIIPIKVDLRSHHEITKTLKNSSYFDSCVYLAGNGDPAVSVEKSGYDLELNTLALLNLINNVTFGKFVYFSSGAVYDGLKGAVSPERSVRPKLPYAISKLASEYYLKHFKEKGRIKDLIIVRFFGAYGPYEPERKIYSRLVKQFAFNKNPQYSIKGDGKNLIDAMYIDNAVFAIHLLLKSSLTDKTLDLYSGTPLSLTQLVAAAARVFNLEAQISYSEYVPEYIEFYSVDETMKKEFGFAPKTSLNEGLRALYHTMVEE